MWPTPLHPGVGHPCPGAGTASLVPENENASICFKREAWNYRKWTMLLSPWGYRQEQELQITICNLCDSFTDLIKPVWTVSYHWGTAVGGLFFDTTLQGAGQGSQSLPNSHTLNSSNQNVSRRQSCGLHQCWAESQPVDTWQELVVGSPPLVGGLLCPL